MPSSFVRGEFQDFWDNHASLGKPFLFLWNPGNPGSFEKDGIFTQVVVGSQVSRPLSTQVSNGLQDISFSVIGIKEI